jgi:hypothetical protein
MKALPTADYLNKGSNSSWADCLAQTPGVGIADYGDTDYLYAGKAYVSPQFDLAQMFLRFDVSAIPASHEIVSATLRLYLVEAPDTDFTLRVGLCDATWGTLTDADWDASCTEFQGTSSGYHTTDGQGRAYIEMTLAGALLAAVTESATTIDMRLWGANETIAPTDKEWLKCYAPAYSDEDLRPYLKVVTKDRKMQILDAVVSKLGLIDEFSGYESSPKTVTAEYKLLEKMSEPQFPCVFPIVDDEVSLEGTLGLELRRADFTFIAAIWNSNKGLRAQDLLALQRDIKRVIYANRQLGLAEFVQSTNIRSVETGFLYVADDFRAASAIRIEVAYTEDPNET